MRRHQDGLHVFTTDILQPPQNQLPDLEIGLGWVTHDFRPFVQALDQVVAVSYHRGRRAHEAQTH
eukprot:1106625-Pyramimonas_sp.AAC.1